ncbi:MAG: hypothetical protein U1F34_01540 [Gammaproteobacteria bacterium]
MSNSPVVDVLYRIKRGLSGYVSYLAACEMNESFSEYVLYEPTLRILTARGFSVECEVPCPGFPKQGAGDFKKLDFVAKAKGSHFAIEMKWLRDAKVNVKPDLEKLQKYRQAYTGARAFLFLFGRKSHIENVVLGIRGLHEQGKPVFAEFGVTRYGCRNYECSDG